MKAPARKQGAKLRNHAAPCARANGVPNPRHWRTQFAQTLKNACRAANTSIAAPVRARNARGSESMNFVAFAALKKAFPNRRR
jgi:hypothetical protein